MEKVIINKNKNIIKPELLAPAGDLERLKWAILYGADAVYIGGPLFGLRANAINFTLEEIKAGVLFAHQHNCKVYVTVNIILHNKELKHLTSYLKELDSIGVDAIIVSDPTVLFIAKNNTNLEVHISTQQSTLNYEAVEFWKNEGVTRVVLAREATKENIKEIKDKVDIEIECFIHGAMCAGLSGRCVLSNFLTDRDANRGGCSQICRWDFELLDQNRKNLKGDKNFTFCTKDLSMLKCIPDMIASGISSFKIEGRMRSVYYIATILSVYRRAIDNYCKDPINYQYNVLDEIILNNCANRDSITQFFNSINDETCQYYNNRVEISNQDFLGIVRDYDEQNKIMTLEQRNYFKKGDEVEIFGPTHEVISYTIDEVFDEDGKQIEIVRHPRQVVTIKIDAKINKNDLMRKTSIKVDKTKNS